MTTASAHGALGAPAKWRMLAEFRSIGELGFSIAAYPLLAGLCARGDGHPVLVLPGFLTGDASTYLTRRFLHAAGFDAYGWELGRNMGGIRSRRAEIAARLERIASDTGKRVSIVGWSLGGVFARDLALARPELVRYVIGLASPLSRDMRTANTGKLYARTAPGDTDDAGDSGMLAREFDALGRDLACPSTAMYSRCDGIVNWKTCLIHENQRSENLEIVGSSHTGFGVHAAALYAVADRLAQPEGTFARFTPARPFTIAYGTQRRTRAD